MLFWTVRTADSGLENKMSGFCHLRIIELLFAEDEEEEALAVGGSIAETAFWFADTVRMSSGCAHKSRRPFRPNDC